MSVSQCPLSRRELVAGRAGKYGESAEGGGCPRNGKLGKERGEDSNGCYVFTLARQVQSRCRISGLLLSPAEPSANEKSVRALESRPKRRTNRSDQDWSSPRCDRRHLLAYATT